MGYFHEFVPSSKPKETFNTVWPTVTHDRKANECVRNYLLKRRLDPEIAYLNGWYPTLQDCLRIVIPCVSLKEGHAYYQARAVDKEVPLRYRSPFGHRHGAICEVSTAEESSPVTAVVEGPMDALALAGLGITSIAVMGIQPDHETKMHLLFMVRSKHLPAVVIFDNEDEAQRQSAEIALFLASHGVRSRTFVTQNKDFAASPDDERKTLVKRITTWAKHSR